MSSTYFASTQVEPKLAPGTTFEPLNPTHLYLQHRSPLNHYYEDLVKGTDPERSRELAGTVARTSSPARPGERTLRAPEGAGMHTAVTVRTLDPRSIADTVKLGGSPPRDVHVLAHPQAEANLKYKGLSHYERWWYTERDRIADHLTGTADAADDLQNAQRALSGSGASDKISRAVDAAARGAAHGEAASNTAVEAGLPPVGSPHHHSASGSRSPARPSTQYSASRQLANQMSTAAPAPHVLTEYERWFEGERARDLKQAAASRDHSVRPDASGVWHVGQKYTPAQPLPLRAPTASASVVNTTRVASVTARALTASTVDLPAAGLGGSNSPGRRSGALDTMPRVLPAIRPVFSNSTRGTRVL
jgi:hypothetical protein